MNETERKTYLEQFNPRTHVLGRIVILQVGLIHHVMHKTRGVLHACCVCGRIRTVQSQMEMEIREILFQA